MEDNATHMHIRAVLVAIALTVAVLIVVGLFVFLRSPAPASNATSTPSGGLPVSGSIPGGSTGVSSATSTPGIAVATRDGSAPLAVRDFIHNATTVQDSANKGIYYLTGSSTEEFVIAYDSSAQFFTIALNREPIGLARTDAQTMLVAALGVPQESLCALKYYVGTDEHTNSFYAGKNLGFSFCPGATALPQ